MHAAEYQTVEYVVAIGNLVAHISRYEAIVVEARQMAWRVEKAVMEAELVVAEWSKDMRGLCGLDYQPVHELIQRLNKLHDYTTVDNDPRFAFDRQEIEKFMSEDNA